MSEKGEKRKATGRPPIPEEEKQRRASLPAFIFETGSGVKVSVLMDNPTRQALDDYLEWAVNVSGLSRNEAELRFMSAALPKAIRADKAYQAARKASIKSSKPEAEK
jgi:hypothetical protein